MKKYIMFLLLCFILNTILLKTGHLDTINSICICIETIILLNICKKLDKEGK